ncbi:MAG: GGDEF domain-containing protein [Christensenellales bacterium]|jgi:diguanylate cyclase (GGDEF)-like protein
MVQDSIFSDLQNKLDFFVKSSLATKRNSSSLGALLGSQVSILSNFLGFPVTLVVGNEAYGPDFPDCMDLARKAQSSNILSVNLSSQPAFIRLTDGVIFLHIPMYYMPKEKASFLEVAAIQLDMVVHHGMLQNHLSESARTDPLTGLMNRRGFMEALEAELSRGKRHHCNMALIIIDLDRFKVYNDSFGHPAGDELLKALGKLLSETIRKEDFAGRVGGEEFAIAGICQGYDSAWVMAERVRREVESNLKPDRRTAQRQITVSAGGSLFPDDGTTVQELYTMADIRLYQAKEAGRNQVVVGRGETHGVHISSGSNHPGNNRSSQSHSI